MLSMYIFPATGCWFATSEVPGLKFEIGPHTQRSSRDARKKANHSKLVGGSVSKPGSL